MDALSYFALVLLIGTVLILAYGLIIIHDIPYKIAKKRNHPHADAIHCAGWVSLFLLHAIWPFLWIWAMLYHPERGFSTAAPGKESAPENDDAGPDRRIDDIERRLTAIETEVQSPRH